MDTTQPSQPLQTLDTTPAQSTQPEARKKTPFALIAAMVVMSGVIGIGGYMLGKQISSSPTATPLTTPTVTTLPASTPNPTETDVTSSWQQYTAANNAFSFRAPANVRVKIDPQFIRLYFGAGEDSTNMTISYTLDGTKPTGYSGTPAGDSVNAEPIDFFGTKMSKLKLVFQGKTTALYYGGELGNNMFTVNQMKFIINADFGLDPEITPETEVLVDQILSTFSTSKKGVTSNPSQTVPLSQILAQNCKNDAVSLNNLPFTLTQDFKSRHLIDDKIPCYPSDNPTRRYAIVQQPSTAANNNNTIYFFHSNSLWDGFENVFTPLSMFQKIQLDGQTVSLNVREPDPYGISTMGINVQIIIEKTDEKTDTIVRSVGERKLTDNAMISLVRKHGKKVSDQDIYALDINQKQAFLAELYPLLAQSPDMKALATSLQMDLDGVQF